MGGAVDFPTPIAARDPIFAFARLLDNHILKSLRDIRRCLGRKCQLNLLLRLILRVADER